MLPRARSEALAWSERLKRDQTAATRAEFEGWLAADAANRAEYAQFGALDMLMAGEGLRSTRPVADRRRPLWPVLAGTAATAAIVLVAPGGLPFTGHHGGPSLISAAEAQLARPLRLPDGTLVILGAAAKAEPHYSPVRRQVTLRGGAARFVVARDPARPFVVEAGAVRAATRDGVFDVDPAAEGGNVTAWRGHVVVARASDSGSAGTTRVPVAQRIDVATLALTPAPRSERVTVIEADNLALGDLLRIANAEAGTPLVADTPTVTARRLTGRFDIRDHHKLARRLAAALGLRLEARADTLVLTPQ